MEKGRRSIFFKNANMKSKVLMLSFALCPAIVFAQNKKNETPAPPPPPPAIVLAAPPVQAVESEVFQPIPPPPPPPVVSVIPIAPPAVKPKDINN